MRRLIWLAVPLLLSYGILSPPGVIAQGTDECTVVWQPDPVTGLPIPRYQCGDKRDPSRPGDPTNPGAGDPPVFVAWRLVAGPDGPCMSAVMVEAEVDPAIWDQWISEMFAAGYDFCPGVEPVITPTVFALEWWDQYQLPGPEPFIEPGEAVTGWPSYLQTGSERTLTIDVPDTPFGVLHIDASATYDIDWGDQRGEDMGPHETVGGPYPDGEIRHVYQAKGLYDVTVTAHWTGTWQLGGESGTFPIVDLTGTIDDFEVTEVQAIITR